MSEENVNHPVNVEMEESQVHIVFETDSYY